jgi:hypothetical protein
MRLQMQMEAEYQGYALQTVQHRCANLSFAGKVEALLCCLEINWNQDDWKV